MKPIVFLHDCYTGWKSEVDLSGVIDSVTHQLASTQAGAHQHGLNVLKVAVEVEKGNAQQLIESVPEAPPPSNPEHLGNNVDVTV